MLIIIYILLYFLDPWRQLTGNQHSCLYIAKTTLICYFPWVDSSVEFYRKFVQHMKSSPIVMVFGIFKTRWVIILTVSLISWSKYFNFWIIRGIGSLLSWSFRGISSLGFPRSTLLIQSICSSSFLQIKHTPNLSWIRALRKEF